MATYLVVSRRVLGYGCTCCPGRSSSAQGRHRSIPHSARQSNLCMHAGGISSRDRCATHQQRGRFQKCGGPRSVEIKGVKGGGVQ